MLCFNQNKVNVCNIGDSPIYCFNHNQLFPIYEEHTGRKMAERILGKEKVLQKKFPLTQHIGIDPSEMLIVPYTNTLDIQPEAQYLICSDGLTDMVQEEKIQEILSSQMHVTEKVSTLFQTALDNGGKDNVSIILIQTKKVKSNLPIIGIICAVIVLVICFYVTSLF